MNMAAISAGAVIFAVISFGAWLVLRGTRDLTPRMELSIALIALIAGVVTALTVTEFMR